MLKVLRPCLLLAFAGCLLLTQSVMAADTVKGKLVSPKWLENNLKNADVLVLDASPAQIYGAKHIPGAISVDLYTYGVRVPTAEMEQLYRSWGISPGKKIVIYDQGGAMMATKLFFSLDHHGYPVNDLFVLDGGLSKWEEEKRPITKDVTPAPKKGTFKIGKVNDAIQAELPEVLTATGDTVNNVLVEALGPDWHYGQVAPFNRAGHIPNAVLLPSADFYNPDKTFKSPEEITKMLQYFGVRPEQRIYTYCGGGVAASVPFFALKFIVNYPNVKMYTDSEMGWLSDERQLPFWTYGAPFLMRDAGWLQFWGGPVLRRYAGARVSIIDVRSADAFNQGHVPFALNIPIDVFKSNINNAAKLADILGPAGVDATQEAIIISGAGLTKDSALAFLMLERLGQTKVSVFIDSMDKEARGPNLTQDPTVVGPKKSRTDPSIPPVTYATNLRKDLIITDAKSTQGVYPKIFIASGTEAPSKAQTGKVIYVPYTNLLNADGTPKPAKDIWSVLTKAGVPRYAELVCFSDDPGEAAVNYFVLKLMGYPDVKVLLN